MRSFWAFVLVCLSALTVTGCELAGDIFQAGMWVGIVAILIVIVMVGFVVSKLRS